MNYLVLNWKMNPVSLEEAERLFKRTERAVSGTKAKVIICLPTVYLSSFKNRGVSLGAQDVFWKEAGAYTGEISPRMLKDLNCEYVLVGHSERRRYLNETRDMTIKKTKTAFKEGLKPILFVEESAEVIPEAVLVVYEPAWAVGSGRTPTLDELTETLEGIRDRVNKQPVLYGGSVDSGNAEEIVSVGFDGLAVGGASLDPEEIEKIAEKL